MDILIICQEAGFRRNVNVNTLERELGTSTITFDTLLRRLTSSSSTLQSLSRRNELAFHYVDQDGRLVPVRAADPIKSYASYQNFYLLPTGRSTSTSIPGYSDTPQRSPITTSTPSRHQPPHGQGCTAPVIVMIVLVIIGTILFAAINNKTTTQPTVNQLPSQGGKLTITTNFIYGVSFARNKPIFALSTGDGVIIYDVSTGQVKQTNHIGSNIYSTASDWSPDGNYLAAAINTAQVEIWDTNSWNLHSTWKSSDSIFSRIISISFSPDSKKIAVNRGDGKLHIIDTNAQEIAAYDENIDSEIGGMSWSPDGSYIVTRSADKQILQFIDPNNGSIEKTTPRNGTELTGKVIAISPDGQKIAISMITAENIKIRVYTFADLSYRDYVLYQIVPMQTYWSIDPSAVFSQNDTLVVSDPNNGMLLLDLTTGNTRKFGNGEHYDIIEISPDRHIVVGINISYASFDLWSLPN